MPALYKSKIWLTKKYQAEHLNARQIAVLCNTTEVTVWRWLDHFGLIRNRRNLK